MFPVGRQEEVEELARRQEAFVQRFTNEHYTGVNNPAQPFPRFEYIHAKSSRNVSSDGRDESIEDLTEAMGGVSILSNAESQSQSNEGQSSESKKPGRQRFRKVKSKVVPTASDAPKQRFTASNGRSHRDIQNRTHHEPSTSTHHEIRNSAHHDSHISTHPDAHADSHVSTHHDPHNITHPDPLNRVTSGNEVEDVPVPGAQHAGPPPPPVVFPPPVKYLWDPQLGAAAGQQALDLKFFNANFPVPAPPPPPMPFPLPKIYSRDGQAVHDASQQTGLLKKAKKKQSKGQAKPPTGSTSLDALMQPAQMAQTRSNGRGKSPLQHLLPRPQPTLAYKLAANAEPQTTVVPRQLLLIIDLNGTLLYRRQLGSTFIGRPHVMEFLQYLMRHHNIMIWSSARSSNVKPMCDELFTPEQREQLTAIWARDKLQLTTAQYKQRVQVYKQLSWVWADQDVQRTRPLPDEEWNQTNTVLIDDSFEKAASEPYNLVEIDAFEGTAAQEEVDVLGEVARYLEQLKFQRNVSAFIKRYPFKYVQPAVPFNWAASAASLEDMLNSE